MKTKLLYLEDTYLFAEDAHFLEVREHEKGTAVVLDQTIFYPQGGGQPSDTGYIRGESGIFRVDFVGLDSEGVIWHVGAFEEGSFVPQKKVHLEIDQEKRVLHARIHSAGHLLDVALKSLSTPLIPAKGYHFPQGPYVEYQGEVSDTESLKVVLEQKINELVTQDTPVKKVILEEEEAKAKGMHAPIGKSVRVVSFEGDEGCGCGGTHVASSKEIGKITIRKISSKQGITRISYSLE